MLRYLPLLAAVALVASAATLWLSQRPAPAEPGLVIGDVPASKKPVAADTHVAEAAGERRVAQASEQAKVSIPPEPAAPKTYAPASTGRAAREALDEAELSALLQRRLTPAMRRDINQQLQPGGQAPQLKQGRYGSYLDLSDRASSVMIAVIDDDGGTVVTDITEPLADADR